ncbi:class I SAM-dependent methyltransferase [Allokutzneria oryzae]|uniref:Class I SAM-dependent methyltransferase n=1 Tax=Allokutzneria oryzae TaxID=1378989 RepID=A0ABV5ZT90_9PSEU
MTESTTAQVDPSNAEQLSDWNGDQGAFWTERADRFNEGVAAYHGHFFDTAAIEATDTVLDIGCGSGQTTREAARRATAGSALGVDLSSPLIELARSLAAEERVANATFLQADAQIHPFPAESFDVAVSRHGAMFFGDPPAAFANIARALRPGGRLVLLTWQPMRHNEWIRTFRSTFAAGRELPTPVPRPGALNDPDLVRDLLGAAGFSDVRLRGVSEPMYFGRDVEDAREFVLGQFGWMLRELDVDSRDRALDELRTSLAEHATERGVFYGSAAWLIEARRA